MKNTITVAGIGPGNKNLILPAVHQAVAQAQVLVGGRRQMELFPSEEKHCITIAKSIDSVVQQIEEHAGLSITAIVSGDTGYHSFLRTLRHKLPQWQLRAIPGISSFQYLYAALGLSYENAYLGSVHGTSISVCDLPTHHDSYFFLTDTKHDYRFLAQSFVDNGKGDWHMHVGNRLSYPNETIWSGKAADFINRTETLQLCAVLIEKP